MRTLFPAYIISDNIMINAVVSKYEYINIWEWYYNNQIIHMMYHQLLGEGSAIRFNLGPGS